MPSKMFAPSGMIPTAAEREVQRQWDEPRTSTPGSSALRVDRSSTDLPSAVAGRAEIGSRLRVRTGDRRPYVESITARPTWSTGPQREKVDEMLVTPTGLRTAPETVNEPIPQQSSAADWVECGTRGGPDHYPAGPLRHRRRPAGTRRAPLGSRLAAALRRMAADANQPRHPHYLRHYTYLEGARMARERRGVNGEAVNAIISVACVGYDAARIRHLQPAVVARAQRLRAPLRGLTRTRTARRAERSCRSQRRGPKLAR